MTVGLRSREVGEGIDAERAFLALHGADDYAFWFDPGEGARTGVSVMGAARPGARLLREQDGAVTVAALTKAGWSAATPLPGGSILDAVDAMLPEPARGGPGGFVPGWVGWIGYETGSRLVGTPSHPARTPDSVLVEIDRAVLIDHPSGTARAVILADSPGAEAWLDEVEELLAAAPEPPQARLPGAPSGPVRSRLRHRPDDYEKLVRACQDAIADGEAYQLCLTNEVLIDVHPDPVELYRAVRRQQPAPHGGLLRFGEIALLSASPERFLSVDPEGIATTCPIKGTRPRGADASSDDRLRDELRFSDKERAENLMIVDLMRNDLGRIAEVGSVRVPSLFAVESFPAVHQLVSTVVARLPEGRGATAVLRASLPPGSMTGAPKHAAMRILNALEAGPRGIYSGVFGWIGRDGTADLAVVIRSLVVTPEGVSLGVGGGITALSRPREELEETFVKAAPLLRILGAEQPSTLG